MRTLATVLAVTLAGIMVGCSENAAKDSAPQISDMAAERQRVSAEIKKRKGVQRKTQQVAKADKPKPKPKQKGSGVVDTALGPVEIDFVYESRDRRDPFRSAFWAHTIRDAPRGPLEQYELGQLAVTAIVWETGRPRALVADPSGSAYVVKEGSKIGKNEGLVIHIGDNLVLVKETYIDFGGEQSTKDVEMRIRTSQGG
ncbi:MAG: pilus assembly protein PilP [Deltaproteobacteria bacterium]|nr:pilus assembly protein PilP [Deltaproteobacteria bacterium]